MAGVGGGRACGGGTARRVCVVVCMCAGQAGAVSHNSIAYLDRGAWGCQQLRRHSRKRGHTHTHTRTRLSRRTLRVKLSQAGAMCFRSSGVECGSSSAAASVTCHSLLVCRPEHLPMQAPHTSLHTARRLTRVKQVGRAHLVQHPPRRAARGVVPACGVHVVRVCDRRGNSGAAAAHEQGAL
jgi:hypothetical protein